MRPTAPLLVAAVLLVPVLAATARENAPSQPRSDYIEYCAGCHGMNGSSQPAPVPELRGRAGYFMCTREGRAYLIRLPNVSHAPIADAGELAALMNYVVFSIGKVEAMPARPAFSAGEVEQLRRQPLRPGASLVALRRRLVADVIRNCAAPATLRNFYSATGARGEAGDERRRDDRVAREL